MFDGNGRNWRFVAPDPHRRRLPGAFLLGPIAAALAVCGLDACLVT